MGVFARFFGHRAASEAPDRAVGAYLDVAERERQKVGATKEQMWRAIEYVCQPPEDMTEPLTQFREDVRLDGAYRLVDEARLFDPKVPMPNAALLAAERGNLPPNFIRVTGNPPTKTGRPPKYPETVAFSLYGTCFEYPNKPGTWTGGTDGAHGEIRLLSDGTPGRADINVWLGHMRWGLSGRVIGGVLRLWRLERGIAGDEPELVYEAQRPGA